MTESTAQTAAVPTSAQNAAPLSYPVELNLKSLLDVGAHFGHQTERWNPKMLPYIYAAKNKVHIINLDITLAQWKKARQYLVDIVSRGGQVLFVGTKQQARESIKEEARRCDEFYVDTRWLGGTLSNFQTIKNSIDRMRRLEDLLAKAADESTKVKLTKKEKLDISRELEKLERSLGGIRQMRSLPQAVFVVDVVKEAIVVAECRRLRIPVIGIIDTNADPEIVDYPIASNDDAARTIRLFLAAAADAVLEGKALRQARRPKEQREEAPQAAAPAQA